MMAASCGDLVRDLVRELVRDQARVRRRTVNSSGAHGGAFGCAVSCAFSSTTVVSHLHTRHTPACTLPILGVLLVLMRTGNTPRMDAVSSILKTTKSMMHVANFLTREGVRAQCSEKCYFLSIFGLKLKFVVLIGHANCAGFFLIFKS